MIKRALFGGLFLFLNMQKQILFALLFFISIKEGIAQNYVGFGAALHRYDQVLSVKGVRDFQNSSLGLELGCGVERSIQGALAPQFALFWQAPFPLKNRHYPMSKPSYSFRYQFDFQHAAILDTYHACYVGLGYDFGSRGCLQLHLSVGVVAEKMYIPKLPVQNLHFFINQQLQLGYYIKRSVKGSLATI